MSLILVAKKSGKKVDLSKVVKNGKYVELAVPGEEYYVIDSETGKTPEDIEVSRSGDDLIIKSPSEDITVVIDEFWHDCTPDNQCYAIFDVPAVDGLEAGQVTVTQSGPDISAFKPGMVGILPEGHSVSPWLWTGLGAALLGGLAAGGGGGGSSAKDVTPPAPPTNLKVIDGTHVTGTAEPGAKVTIRDGNVVIGEGTADSNGRFDVPVSPSKTNGETLTAEATDAAGNTSAPETVQADDTIPPDAPRELQVSDDGKHVIGTAEPGTTVIVRDADGEEIGRAIADPKTGAFNAHLGGEPKINKEELTVTATDVPDNLTSDPAKVTAQDKTPPVIESAVITDVEGQTIEGKTEPGAKVVVKEGDQVIGEGEANQEGNFTIKLTEPKNNGEQLTVVATDDKQNDSTPYDVEPVDNTAPAGTVNISYTPPGNGNLYNANEVGDDGTVPVKVTFTDVEEGAKVVIDYGREQKTITVDAQNKVDGVSLEVAPGTKVTAKLVDDANNVGSENTATVPNADVDAPIVTPAISFESTGADDIYNREEVEGGAENTPDTVTATVTVEGMQEGDKLFVNEEEQDVTLVGGKATVTIEVIPGRPVTAYVQDAVGNKGPEGRETAPAADTEPPSTPTSIEFSSNIAPKDDVLTRNEIKTDDKVPVKVGLPAGMQDGDTVTVTPSNGGTQGTPVTQTITKADITNGFVTVSVPVGVNAGKKGTLSATASFTDKAGNLGTVTNPVNIDVDRTIVGTPSIKYDSDTDGNGVLTGTEIGTTTAVTLYLPKNISEQDTITISVGGKPATVVFTGDEATGIEYNGQTYQLANMSPEEGLDYKVTINNVPVSETATEVASSINIQFSDANLDSRLAEETITIDRTLPGGADANGDGKGDGAPEITFIPDASNPSLENDGTVNAAELKDGVLVNVKLPEDVQAGDVIVLKNNGIEIYTYPIPSDQNTASGEVVGVIIPKEKLTDGQYNITASVKEPYETGARESADSNQVGFMVDTSVPGDSNNDGVADTGGKPGVEVVDAGDDGKVGTSDLNDGLQVTVTLPPNTKTGDTVVITLTKPDGTTQDFPFKTGNSDGEVPITGDAPNQTVTITIPTDSLPKDDNGNVVDGPYKATATVKDDAGNTSLPSDPKSFDVDTIIPGDTNGDGVVDNNDKTDTASNAPFIRIPEADNFTKLINAAEFKDGVQVEVTLPTKGVEVGDKVVLTVTPSGAGAQSFEVSSEGLTQTEIDAGKATVTIPNDANITVKDGSAPYSVTAVVKDAAGNTSATSNQDNFKVDAEVPGDSNSDGVANSSDTNLGKPLVAIPENENGGIDAQEFNDGVGIQVTPPVNTKSDDTIVLTITPKKGGEPITYSQVAGSNSPVMVTVPKDTFGADPEGEYTVTAQVKDAAGNASAVSDPKPLTILDLVIPGDTNGDGIVNDNDTNSIPSIAIAATAESATGAGDAGKITAAELNADNGVKVKVTLPSGVEPGDIIVIKNDSNDLFSYTIPEGTDTAQGKTIDVTVPKENVPSGNYSFTATVKEPVGTHETGTSNQVNFSIDAIVPGDSNGDGKADNQDVNAGKPTVTISEAANGVNEEELGNGVQVKVSLPVGTQVGDTVTLTVTTPGGNTFLVPSPAPGVTAADLANNSITVTIPNNKFTTTPPDGDYSVTAQITDSFGNTSAQSDSVPFTIDTTDPMAPEITSIRETGTDTLGGALVNAGELSDDGINVNVKLPQGAKAGDTVTVVITPNGKPAFTASKTLDSDVEANSVVTVNIPRNQFPEGTAADGNYSAIARVTDKAGNVGADSVPAGFTVDMTIPGDTNGDGVVNDTDTADGAKNAPSITIPEAGENKLVNAAEFRDGVQVEVTLPTKGVEVGDKVVLTVTPSGAGAQSFEVSSEGLTQIEINAGKVTVTIPNDANITVKDGSAPYSVTGVVKDTAGNTSEPSNSAEFIVDTQNPGTLTLALAEGTDADNNATTPMVISGADLTSDGGVKVTVGLPAGAAVDDVVNFLVNIPNKGATGSLAQLQLTSAPLTKTDLSNRSISFVIPEADIRAKRPDVDSLEGESPYTIAAYMTDTAGNRTSSSVQFTVDTKAPSKDGLAVAIPEATTPENDGLINPDELASDNGVKVEVTLPTGIQPGDKVNVTVTGPNGETITLDPHEVAAGETAGGKVPFIIPADKLKQDGQPVDGDYTITATVSDSVGNTSQGVPSSFTLDTTATEVAAVTFASDKLPTDNILTNKEIGTDNTVPVHITLSEAIKAGDTIKIFTGGASTPTVTYTVKPEDIGKTELDILVPVGVDDEAKGNLAVNVQVVDKAGNASDLEATASHAEIDVDRTHVNLMIEYTEDNPPKDGLLIGEEVSGSTTPVKITLPSSLAAGDTVKITINDGVTTYTVKENEQHQMTLVQSDAPNKALVIENGAVTIHPDTTGLSSITTTVIITPANGGDTISDAETLKLDSSAPSGTVTIAVPEATTPENDGKINAAELKDGVQVAVTLPSSGVQSGDIIEIKENGTVLASYTIKPTDPTTGNITVTIPSDKLADGSHTVTATVKEPHADNVARSVNSLNTVTFTVDATAPGDGNGTGEADDGDKPVVEVVDDSLTKTEFEGGVTVKVTLPEGTQVGDTVILKVTGGELSSEGVTYDTYTVQENDLQGAGAHVATINIPKTSLTGVEGGDYTITAQVKDDFGNASPVSDPDNFTVDTMAPGGGNGTGDAGDGGKPVVEVTDDLLNKTEFEDGVTVKVTLPEGTEVGDTVILKVAGDNPSVDITYDTYTVQASDLPTEGDHVAIITIPKASLPGVEDGAYTITAQVKDGVGQLSPVSAPDDFTVDTILDGVTAVGDNNTGDVTITIPAEATKVVVTTQPTGEVTLTKDENGQWLSSNPDVVPAPIGDGPFTTTIPGNQLDDGSTVKVVAEDKAGNTAPATVTAPDINDAPVLTLTQEAGLSFTAGQATANTKLAHASATDADGDKVTLTLENNTDGYYRLDSATGDIYLTQEGANYVNGGNNLPDLQVKATDVRTGSDSLSDTKSLDLPDTIARDTTNTLEVTSNDGTTVQGRTDPGSTVTVYNAKGELVGTATADATGAYSVTLTRTVSGQYPDQPNQTFKLDTDGDGVADKDVTTDASGNYSYTVNNPIVTGETLTVKSVDPNNNLAETTTDTPDRLAPNPPVIAISDDGTTITGTAEPGSTIKLTVTDSNGTSKAVIPGTTQGVTIDQKEDGSFTVTFEDPLTDKETVTATATDTAATPNTSLPSNEVTAPFINNTLENISIALANDTGALPDDKITNDGSLKLSQPSQGAVITHVEYKGDDGQYHEIALGENGTYVLPEGEYEPGAIRVTQQDANGAAKYSTNNDTFVVDTTPPVPATAERDVSSGNVVITLPSSAEAGDTVQVFVGTTEVTLTRGEDGSWISDNQLVTVPAGTRDGGKITISVSESVPSGTGVSVQSFDVAGNTAAKDNDIVLDSTNVTVVFANPALNGDVSNDLADGTILLNKAEMLSGGSTSDVKFTVYLPDNAKAGDSLTLEYGGRKFTRILNDAMIKDDHSFVLGLAGNQIPYPSVQETNAIKATFTKQGASTSVSDTLKFNTDIYTPDMPEIVSKPGGNVTITLPNTTTTDEVELVNNGGTQVKDGDKVLITAGDQSVELIRNNGVWEEVENVEWLNITGTTATIPANLSKFPYGTTITAQAYDPAGNKSAMDTGHVVENPLQYTDFRITNEDKVGATQNVVDTNESTIRYEATISGQEDKESMIKVELQDNGITIATQYLDITADKTTYTGAFTGIVADSKQYTLRSEIVGKETKDALAGSAVYHKKVLVDNVAPTIQSITLGDNGSLNVVLKDGSDKVTDTNNGASASAATTGGDINLTTTFGTAQADKQHTLVDAFGNSVTVNSPNLDWLMRWEDDAQAWWGPAGDNRNNDTYHNDHAPGWQNPSRDDYKWSYWNGSNDKADMIIAATVRTDDGYSDRTRQGLIGTEGSHVGGSQGFDINTQGGGADYIESKGIVGNVRIYTNDGDDVINTKFLSGNHPFNSPDFDGSQQFYMGEGNDTLNVSNTFNGAGDVFYGNGDSSLFYTNVKVDMGSGNDTVNIAGKIIAGAQVESGNYFDLGDGNDTMTTGAITSEYNAWEASNIINLGKGQDTLTINGDISGNETNGGEARFLLFSQDSSTVHITGSVNNASNASMLMGSGVDNITIDGGLSLASGVNSMRWLYETFNHTYNNGVTFRDGYYGPDFYGELRDLVNESLSKSFNNTDGRMQLGAGVLADNTQVSSRIDLGDGDNVFQVKGNTGGARILSGSGNDTIKLGNFDDPSHFSGSIDTVRISTGAGNDSVVVHDAINNNVILGGTGNDAIELHGISGTGNIIEGGAGNDTVRLYGTVKSHESNFINGGADYDKVVIGNASDGSSNFVIGGVQNGYTNLLGMEEIQFNSYAGGDAVKVNTTKLNDLNTLYIRGTAELTARGGDSLGINQVDIDTNVWTDKGFETKTLSDGSSYQYHHYTVTVGSDEQHLYIQTGISII